MLGAEPTSVRGKSESSGARPKIISACVAAGAIIHQAMQALMAMQSFSDQVLLLSFLTWLRELTWPGTRPQQTFSFRPQIEPDNHNFSKVHRRDAAQSMAVRPSLSKTHASASQMKNGINQNSAQGNLRKCLYPDPSPHLCSKQDLHYAWPNHAVFKKDN